MLSQETFRQYLTARSFGSVVHAFESIDSTNNVAKSSALNGAPHGTVVVAEEQTAGRGRLQRQWISNKGENLLFTVIIVPAFSAEKIALLPFAGSLAVADAIEEVTGLSPACKWPNDVLVNGKKVSGMLLESVTGPESIQRIALGIGINVNQSEFPPDLLYKASSLRNESGREVDRPHLLASVLNALELRYEQLSSFPPAQLLGDWKMKALLFGKKILVLEGEFSHTATAVDVAEDGGLIIQDDDGRRRKVYAGDVSLAYE